MSKKVRLYRGQRVHARWPQTRAGRKTGKMVIVLAGPLPRKKIAVPFSEWNLHSCLVDRDA